MCYKYNSGKLLAGGLSSGSSRFFATFPIKFYPVTKSTRKRMAALGIIDAIDLLSQNMTKIFDVFNYKLLCNYNGGQKSWDKFTFVAFFHTCQTNSQARIHLHIFRRSPPPPSIMLDRCTRYFSRGSTLYRGEGGKQRILKRKTVLF